MHSKFCRSWAPVEGLDPWEPIRTNRLEDLNAWLESNPAPAADSTEHQRRRSEKIKDAVTRLLSEPEAKRRALLSEVMSYGHAIVPELRAHWLAELHNERRVRLRQ